jgi:geranylgeranyl pyrophosphate synthase
VQSTITLEELYRPVEENLDQVRHAVTDLWEDALKLVYGPGATPPKMGGKMLRPALCLLSAGALGAKDLSEFVPMATAMELLHIAALAHDDVIDDADTRRGQRSLNAQWDNHTAVLGGDYLVARSIGILGHYDNTRVITNAIDSVREMAEGELTHFGHRLNEPTEESCISLSRQKTASLFAVTCSTPGCLTIGEPSRALHDYGHGFGIAFQIADDLLDLTQDPETLGKPACGDIVEGKTTLPLLRLRAALDDKEVKRLDDMTGGDLSEEDKEWIGTVIESTGVRAQTEAIAQGYADDARRAVQDLGPSRYKDTMIALTEFALARVS